MRTFNGAQIFTEQLTNSGQLDLRYVRITGNQNISNIKNFLVRPTVDGVGVLLQGEGVGGINVQDQGSNLGSAGVLNFAGAGVNTTFVGGTATVNIAGGGGGPTNLPNGILYVSGHQTITGSKSISGAGASFDFVSGAALRVSGNSVLTGVDLSSYSTISYVNALSGNSVLLAGGSQTIVGSKVISGANVSFNFVSGAALRVSGNSVLTGVDLSSYSTISYVNALSGNSVLLAGGSQTIVGSKVISGANVSFNFVSGAALRVSGNSVALEGSFVDLTSNQNIDGLKDFSTTPQVNGTDVALVDGSFVDLTNNQYIDGLKDFSTTPQVNGTNVALEGSFVDLTTNQYIDGLKYFYTTPQVNGTDVALVNGSFVDLTNNQYIDGLKDFSTTPQVNGTNVALEGSFVDLTTNQNIDGIKDFSSRPTVNGVGVLLTGEAGGGGGENVVYTTGNQVISGNKTFDHSSTTTISNLAFRSTSGQLRTFSFVQESGTLTQQIDYINDNVWIARGSANGIYNPQFENGWNNLVSPQGTSWNLDGWNNLSNLDSRDYSGFYDANNGQLGINVTGKNFIMKDEVSDRYYKIYFTGWQVGQGNAAGYRGFGYTRQEVGPRAGALLSGQAVFDQRPIVSGKSVLIEGDIQGGGLVSTTGDQNISGLKNFATIPQVNGTGVLLFGQASPSPIEIFGNGSSQGNASSLNFVGGGISVNTVGAQATITVASSTQVLNPPTSSNSAGVSGAFSFDKNYLYYCVENNQWARTAISTW